MSQTLPPSRLTDVLRRNSMRTLKRHAAELAAASTMLPTEAIHTRFLRNHFLISPKALHLLVDELTLSRHHLFAVYKPPFCPMRCAEAHSNYHKVSVESFINAAMGSQLVLPTLARTLSPKEVHVRVLNDVDAFASGPVLVSVADKHPHATSLKGFTFEYDVLVAGHILATTTTTGGGGGSRRIPTEALFPASESDGGKVAAGEVEEAVESSAPAGDGDCECVFDVVQHGYYSVHPVSLLNVKITSPPSPLPPSMEDFVRNTLETCVIGDPVALGEFITASQQGNSPAPSPPSPSPSRSGRTLAGTRTEAPAMPLLHSRVVTMRGDCDFPRVFTHLREVSFRVPEHDVQGAVIAEKKVEFHCRKCFHGLLRRNRSYSLKASRIGILDGTWTPASEYL